MIWDNEINFIMNWQFLTFFAIRSLLAVQHFIYPQVILTAHPYADEFWQGPEVAHRDVFGYGHLTWEWSRESPIRGPLYHSIFSLFYYLLKLTHTDHQLLVGYGPRM